MLLIGVESPECLYIGYDADTGNSLRNAISDRRCPVLEVVQIEATHNRPIFINEHVKN